MIDKTTAIILGIGIVHVLAIVGVLYIAIHFISKFW